MKLRILVLAVLCGAFASGLARAREVRFPQTGDPAFTLQIPDDWTSRLDDDGNMIVTTADKSAGFSFSIVTYKGKLDDAASEMMQAAKAEPPVNMGADSISRYRGYDYDTTMTNSSGVHLKVHTVLVKLDPKNIASATMITDSAISPEQMRSAEAVLKSAALSRRR